MQFIDVIYLSIHFLLIHSHASKTGFNFHQFSDFSFMFGKMVGRLEKSAVEEINWFSLFDCAGIKTQSCSPSAQLTLTAPPQWGTLFPLNKDPDKDQEKDKDNNKDKDKENDNDIREHLSLSRRVQIQGEEERQPKIFNWFSWPMHCNALQCWMPP